MQSAGLIRRIALLFFIALAVYFALYESIEHQRTHKGPWQVTFTNTATAGTWLEVNQPGLHITNFVIRLESAPAPAPGPMTLRFPEPHRVPYDLPVGRCLFLDTTTLPGTVVMELLGHEVELLPRVLVLDKQELPWSIGSITLAATNR